MNSNTKKLTKHDFFSSKFEVLKTPSLVYKISSCSTARGSKRTKTVHKIRGVRETFTCLVCMVLPFHVVSSVICVVVASMWCPPCGAFHVTMRD